jgi:uncharacterized protein (TIGR03437 family)
MLYPRSARPLDRFVSATCNIFPTLAGSNLRAPDDLLPYLPRLLWLWNPTRIAACERQRFFSILLMRLLPLLTLPLFSYAVGGAQTVINAVTDAASFAPRVAPGALATIFGSNLADSAQQATGFPLPRSLAGATVYVNQAAVPLLYVSNSQINFQVPSGLAAGTANMSVTRDGGQSAVFPFTVVSSMPGIFRDTSNHAVAQNATDNSTNSSSKPVASGAVVVVYLTGQGPVDNPVPDGTAAPDSLLATAAATATATIGGTNATVQFLGLTPGFTGLAQANILVPSLATGDYPLVITVGGYVSASAEISVSGLGKAPPTFLTLVGQLSLSSGNASSIAIYGNTTYICGPNRINIINTSSVSTPAYIGEFGDSDLAGNGGKCVVNTNTSRPILVDIVGPGSAPTFAVYDLTNPDSPAKLAQQTTTPYTYVADLSFLGTVGFASTSWFETSGNSITAQHGDFAAYDFSSLFPALVSAVVPNGTPAANNLTVKPNALALQKGSYNNTAYVTSTTSTGSNTNGFAALDVIDVSNIQSLKPVEQVTVSSAAIFLGFGYDHNLLLVTGNTSSFRNPGVPDFSITGNLTLSTMNITNVQSPVGIKNVTTEIATTGTYVVQPFGSDVFGIVNNPPASDPAGPSSLMVVDARAPTAPVLYPFITQFGMSDIAAINGYLLVPNVNGLMIYKIQTP